MTSAGSHTANVWAKTTDLQVVSGHGCRVVDVDGHEYLDFTAGIAAASTGHSHPKVVKAIADQAGRFIHAQQNVYTHDLLEPLAEKLERDHARHRSRRSSTPTAATKYSKSP